MRSLRFSLPLLLVIPFATEVAAQNTLKAVIGLNSSQFIETLNQNPELSLTPIAGSIIPLINAQPIEISRKIDTQKNWQAYINQTVKIIHRQNQLSYQGRLLSSNYERFEILVDGQRMQLNMMDYNLLVPYKGESLKPRFSINDALAYQTYDIHWQPQLSIFLSDDHAVLKQNALIKNDAFHEVLLAHPILQLKQHQAPPSPMEKMSLIRSASMLSDSAPVEYMNNEITVPTDKDILLKARQTLLFPFKEQKLEILDSRSSADIYPNPRASAKQNIQLEQVSDLILEQDAMPGSYRTYWQHKDYLLPAGTTQLSHLRKGNKVSLKINQNQDVKASYSLVSANSFKFPSTQVWQLSLHNLSNKNQTIEVFHNTNGLLESLMLKETDSLANLSKISANKLKLSYQLVANEKIDIPYEIRLTN